MIACPVEATDAVGNVLSSGRGCLVLAHPGHETWVYGWVERTHPLVCLLTDGSEPGSPRHLESTARILQRLGGRPGGIFGRFTDVGLYQTLLLRDHERFVALAEELAEWLIAEQIDYVVGNATEGLSPSSDVCRMIIDAAVAYAGRSRHILRSYEFHFETSPEECPRELAQRSLWVQLQEESWNQKQLDTMSARRHSAEIDHAIEMQGMDALRLECLRPTVPWAILKQNPEYRYPVEVLRNGSMVRRCQDSVRFREHVLPLAETLRLAAARGRMMRYA